MQENTLNKYLIFIATYFKNLIFIIKINAPCGLHVFREYRNKSYTFELIHGYLRQ